MTSPSKPKPAHVEFDVATGKYVVVRREPGVDPDGYDTLGEALAAAAQAAAAVTR